MDYWSQLADKYKNFPDDVGGDMGLSFCFDLHALWDKFTYKQAEHSEILHVATHSVEKPYIGYFRIWFTWRSLGIETSTPDLVDLSDLKKVKIQPMQGKT